MAGFNRSAPADSSRQLPLPKRSKRYGVGKEIGGAVYVHRRYEHVLGPRSKKHGGTCRPIFPTRSSS